jgi:acetyl-CoA acetyltransferase
MVPAMVIKQVCGNGLNATHLAAQAIPSEVLETKIVPQSRWAT